MAVPPAHPSPPPQPKSSGGGPKSSTVVKLGAVGVLSILVVGFCAAQRTQKVNADCVDTSRPLPDGSYAVVDDDHCDDSSYRYHAPTALSLVLRRQPQRRPGPGRDHGQAGRRADHHQIRPGDPARWLRLPCRGRGG